MGSVLAFLIASQSFAQSGQVTVLKAARLYDGTGAAAVNDAVVVIRGELIEAVGQASQIVIPDGAKVTDLGDQTLMPGLFDTHGHLRYRYAGGGEAAGRAAQAEAKEGWQGMTFVKNARTQLLCGITSMRITGEVRNLDFEIKKAIDSGMVPGPRIIPSGKLITSTGGHGASSEGHIDGPWEAVRIVRDNFHHGARVIKISMTDLSPEAAQLQFEEVKAVVDVAHASGIPVTAHCTGNWGSAIRTAVNAGVDSIEHARPLTDDIIQLLKETGTALSLTPLVYIGFRPNAQWWDYPYYGVDDRSWDFRFRCHPYGNGFSGGNESSSSQGGDHRGREAG